ncbi:MAG: hypothetical protein LQ352_005824 [Teloschistes flavicans]|nr:MAG: hypothetical protein LQ352_005824 [Teloschistes flavicans]
MSSIFTFDPDPPKVLSSPWPLPSTEQHQDGSTSNGEATGTHDVPQITSLEGLGINRLVPEPQDGPTEYKLHLLLRPRRSFSAMSTVQQVSGSHLSKSRLSRSENAASTSLPKLSAAPAASNQSRQARLQNLTTQLLWRLQQSSPHHAASRSDLVVPTLPDALETLAVPQAPGKLLPGLGDSQGALYEIGVADDGTLVGLTNIELDESLRVLHAMASSLGCRVRTLRRMMVGDCQWHEDVGGNGRSKPKLHTEKLWVAEALVSPDSGLDSSKRMNEPRFLRIDGVAPQDPPVTSSASAFNSMALRTDQLRVSLTGSTTSGKSSLLGTLSTSTLDNGRGKSRLSLLKHRHEIASGVTSSVTGSLLGYREGPLFDNDVGTGSHVINYASGNISSWTDIHSVSDPGRLVFLNDSAGHPRFRRTIVRGLVSWAPHWTICCIAADNEEDTRGRPGATASASDVLGLACAEIDLATAHLELCLTLDLPLIVVITKLDLASMSALKPMLGKILSILKSAGRRPEILSCPSSETSFDTEIINPIDEREVLKLLSGTSITEACSTVPIVLASAVTGRGIDKLHALLRHVPVPRPSTPDIENDSAHDFPLPKTLFHVDEIFTVRETHHSTPQGTIESSLDSILSGFLRHGPLVLGQQMIIGPFSTSPAETSLPTPKIHRATSYPKLKGSPKSNSNRRTLPRPVSGDFTITQRSEDLPKPAAVWRRVCISSLRNLRLPVHCLFNDQVGTIGLGLPSSSTIMDIPPLAPQDRIRKGMVLMSLPDKAPTDALQAYNGLVAHFEADETPPFYPGMSVIAYVASVRTPADILTLHALPNEAASEAGQISSETMRISASDFNFGTTHRFKMTLRFLTSHEWFEVGSQLLVMPASTADVPISMGSKVEKTSFGLEGVVGRIVRGLT